MTILLIFWSDTPIKCIMEPQKKRPIRISCHLFRIFTADIIIWNLIGNKTVRQVTADHFSNSGDTLFISCATMYSIVMYCPTTHNGLSKQLYEISWCCLPEKIKWVHVWILFLKTFVYISTFFIEVFYS